MQKLVCLAATIMIFFTAMAADSTHILKAETTAAEQHKYILLNFSGSDWCIPCIKMKKTIFETDTFSRYVTSHLVWMNADFPRSKKNLSKSDIRQNEQLAEKYNKNGAFPFTLLLDEAGNVVKTWDGFPNIPAEEFIKQVDVALNDHRRTHNNTAQKGAQTNGQSL
jgi:thioredoxin-related protein